MTVVTDHVYVDPPAEVSAAALAEGFCWAPDDAQGIYMGRCGNKRDDHVMQHPGVAPTDQVPPYTAPAVTGMMDPGFEAFFDLVGQTIHGINSGNGWWDGQRDTLNVLMLIVTEVAEWAEAARKPGPVVQSDHIPDFDAEEEEAADIIIRVMDAAIGLRAQQGRPPMRLAQAILAKMRYNATRGKRHGGKLH